MTKQILIEVALMQIPAIIGCIWWAGVERANIYDAIDEVNDSLKELYSQLDKRVDLHIQDSHHARETLSERVAGQGKRFGEKFERVERYIEKLVGEKLNE